MMGHRSLYHDGWRAVCLWPGPSFTEAGKTFGEPISADTLTELDAKGWELYHVEKIGQRITTWLQIIDQS